MSVIFWRGTAVPVLVRTICADAVIKSKKKTEANIDFGFAYPASSFSQNLAKFTKQAFPLVLAKYQRFIFLNCLVVFVSAISVGKRSIELAP